MSPRFSENKHAFSRILHLGSYQPPGSTFNFLAITSGLAWIWLMMTRVVYIGIKLLEFSLSLTIKVRLNEHIRFVEFIPSHQS